MAPPARARHWAVRYATSPVTAGAWVSNYVGSGGRLGDKKEWLPAFTKGIERGHIRSVLDAGAGTCSLDGHLRGHGLRDRVRLLSFGFYDCSMARVAAERGSIIFDWTWLDPLPLCSTCTFDLVFQAEGMHHTTARSGAGKGCEIPNFKGSYFGRFPLVSADFSTSEHLSERSRT